MQIFKNCKTASVLTLIATTLTACGEPEPTTIEGRAMRVLENAAVDFPALNATVIINGQLAWEGTAGELVGEDDGPEANYNVYSVAKMMTGMAYAKLLHTEGLDIDQSIRDIDAELPEHLQDVTLRQLLSHTAGIRNYNSDDDWDGFANMRCQLPSDALPHFIGDPLVTAPGEKYEYTTYGFALLSHLLVEITGSDSFDSAMKSVLGDFYTARTDSDAVDKATNYGDALFGFRELDNINAQCKFGAGGLISSARRLAEFGTAMYQGDIVESEALAALLQPGQTNDGEEVTYVFGMGAGLSQNFQPSSHYAAHSGGSPGGRSYLLVFFEPRIAVGMSTNYDGPNLGSVALDLASVFSDQP